MSESAAPVVAEKRRPRPQHGNGNLKPNSEQPKENKRQREQPLLEHVVGSPKLGTTISSPEQSVLLEWLLRLDKDDPHLDRRARWDSLGWEVLERKTLLIAAATDLRANGVPYPLHLAATDIFVEKAQRYLTYRGRFLYLAGSLIAALGLAVMMFAAWSLWAKSPAEFLGIQADTKEVSTGILTMAILKSTTVGAFVGGTAYFLVSLARALLHEGTVLFARRHSLRFGRLFVYLMADRLRPKDLERAFMWNADFGTAFRDIRAEGIAKSPLSRLIDQPQQMMKLVVEAIRASGKRRGAALHNGAPNDQNQDGDVGEH